MPIVRYPEGDGGIPKLHLDVDISSDPRDVYRARSRLKWLLPVPEDALSPTSNAKKCFIERADSRLFQRFMLDYAFRIVKSKVLPGEVNEV